MVAAHGGQGRVAAPCSPRSRLASNPPPRMQKATLLPMTWILAGLGAVGVQGWLSHRQGKLQGLGCPAQEQHRAGLGLAPFGHLMKEQFLIASCALELEISPLCFRYHFICFSTPGWGHGNSPFFNLWAFSIADQALPRQKLHPQSGCLLCRLHSPQLYYLVKSHSCSPFFWWHQQLCHQSHPVLVALGCCGAGTTLSCLICELPAMNMSDAPQKDRTGVGGINHECPSPGSPLSPGSGWQRSPC